MLHLALEIICVTNADAIFFFFKKFEMDKYVCCILVAQFFSFYVLQLRSMYYILHMGKHFVSEPLSLISLVIKPAMYNFLLTYCVIYGYFELYQILHEYVRLSPSEMHDFSLRD